MNSLQANVFVYHNPCNTVAKFVQITCRGFLCFPGALTSIRTTLGFLVINTVTGIARLALLCTMRGAIHAGFGHAVLALAFLHWPFAARSTHICSELMLNSNEFNSAMCNIHTHVYTWFSGRQCCAQHHTTCTSLHHAHRLYSGHRDSNLEIMKFENSIVDKPLG